MAFDHSTTYLDGRLRNLPHRVRLRKLIAECDALVTDAPSKSFADFGCSNGFLTSVMAERYRFRSAKGFDFHRENLATAATRYPSIRFELLDMNRGAVEQQFDFVTCLETVEHLGNPRHGVGILCRAVRPGGTLLISVPIEIGAVGMAKFLVKMAMGQTLHELIQQPNLRWRYFVALLRGRIQSLRDPARPGFGEHFGFDYRSLDAALRELGVPFTARNRASTRFYTVRP